MAESSRTDEARRFWHDSKWIGQERRQSLSLTEQIRWQLHMTKVITSQQFDDIAAGTAIEIGTATLRHCDSEGLCDPSRAELAAETGWHEKTVQRVHIALRRLGLIIWDNRIWRPSPDDAPEQASNAYVFIIPPASMFVVLEDQIVQETLPRTKVPLSYFAALIRALWRVPNARRTTLRLRAWLKRLVMTK